MIFLYFYYVFSVIYHIRDRKCPPKYNKDGFSTEKDDSRPKITKKVNVTFLPFLCNGAKLRHGTNFDPSVVLLSVYGEIFMNTVFHNKILSIFSIFRHFQNVHTSG